jgi:hypothetical protein
LLLLLLPLFVVELVVQPVVVAALSLSNLVDVEDNLK